MPFRPKFAADYRTMLWTFGFAPALVVLQYARPGLVPYLWWVSAYFAISCGVIAHNHNHRPTFGKKWENTVFANWISVFYGYPVFGWIPTHNLNHHRYVNTPGDATITWRYTNSHNILVAATYFFVSAYYQSEPTKQYIQKAKQHNPSLFRRIQLQYLVCYGSHVVLLGLAVLLHGFRTGFYVWGFVLGIPAFISLFSLMLFNYDQHAHTDPWSDHDHSRSFVSPLLNFLMFNNGYHGAHHEKPSQHWSLLGEEHAKIAPLMHEQLKQKSLWWYWFKQYILTPFVPSLGSVQLGPGPWNVPDGKKRSLATADVEAEEAGSNVERLRVPA